MSATDDMARALAGAMRSHLGTDTPNTIIARLTAQILATTDYANLIGFATAAGDVAHTVNGGGTASAGQLSAYAASRTAAQAGSAINGAAIP